MNRIRKALLVDGPRAGARVCVTEHQTHLVLPVPLDDSSIIQAVAEGAESWDLSFREVVYNLTPGIVRLFDRSITIGSVKTGRPEIEDLIDVLLSDEAKDALC